MENSKTIEHMLSLMTRPAFSVENGVITNLNYAAQAMQIQLGTDIKSMLPNAWEDYQAFKGGCLYLPIEIMQIKNGASVTQVENAHIFVVEDSTESAQLNALSLAGVELRMYLSNLNAVFESSLHNQTHNTPKAAQQAGQIHRCLHQMHRVVNNMSDAAYWGRGLNTFAQMDVAAFYNEVMEKTAQYLSTADIQLNYTKADTPMYTRASKEMLERAIYNLVANAAKFSDRGTPLEVSLVRADNRLVLTIENTGHGLHADSLINAFNHYLRKPTAQDARIGIGLGITIVRSTALAHNGTVMICPVDANTTRVAMTLAIDKGEDTILRNNQCAIDYTGGKDLALIELSEVLPASIYENEIV